MQILNSLLQLILLGMMKHSTTIFFVKYLYMKYGVIVFNTYTLNLTSGPGRITSCPNQVFLYILRIFNLYLLLCILYIIFVVSNSDNFHPWHQLLLKYIINWHNGHKTLRWPDICYNNVDKVLNSSNFLRDKMLGKYTAGQCKNIYIVKHLHHKHALGLWSSLISSTKVDVPRMLFRYFWVLS